MIHEFVFPSRELAITRNDDGTHGVRIVQSDGPAMEFTCALEPHVQIRMEIDTSASVVRYDGVICVRVSELDLRIQGRIRPDQDRQAWTMRVLDRDDCGNERNAHSA